MQTLLFKSILFGILIIGIIAPVHGTTSTIALFDDSIKNNEDPSTIFNRLSANEILEISVRTDIERLLSNKLDSKYQTAFIQLKDEIDGNTEWRVEIRTRGKYRKRVCDFPPLKVKFDHSVLGPENLKSFKTLKLVTHCGDQAESEELLLKEYLAYKMLNVITDHSFRVQLVKIDWTDTSGKHSIGVKWGFLIENEDELAQRLGGTVYDQYGVTHRDVNPESASLNSLYQYMIGNPDWELLTLKNIMFVKSNTSSDITVIPYDFDFSGVCNAFYAVTEFDLYSVKERIYLGESSEQELARTKGLLKSKKKEILDMISNFEYISRSGKNEVKKYIKSFYSNIDKPLKTEAFYIQRVADLEKAKKSTSG